MRHIGIRPKAPLKLIDDGKLRVTYHEYLPEGGYRIWNNKLLKSGCGNVIIDHPGYSQVQENDSLLYCPFCEEWASKEQFIDLELT